MPRNLRSLIVGGFAAAVCILGLPVYGQAAAEQDSSNIEQARDEQFERLGALIPDPKKIIADAERELAKPLGEQSDASLAEIADRANTYSNMVSMISDEYSDYINANYKYDFVVEAVRKAPATQIYADLDHQFKDIRNRAYLQLGMLALADGESMRAFLYFRDAYRLSAFECPNGAQVCTRYQAEKYMKDMLGITGDSFVHWQ